MCRHASRAGYRTLSALLLAASVASAAAARCPNAVPPLEVKRRFEALAARDYIGQQQSWNFVGSTLESYTGLAPRATCADWTLHFSGPSGSGKTFLAEVIANAAFEPWEEEAYSFTQLGIASTGGALGGALGWAFGGPLGVGVGTGAGALGASRAWQAATALSPLLQRTFRAPRPFPSQCGVLQHKFSRGSTADEVRAWEHRVAQELLRDPAAVIVVDDVGRLRDAEAFEAFGKLLCGVGGNAIPEFRTEDAQLVPASEALFVLTSDLEVDGAVGDDQISCELGAFDAMLDAVRAQSARFWLERQLHMPDWWERLPLVPFRELCADELSQVVSRYLGRQCEEAGRQVEADLERRSSWALGAQRVHRWTGTVKHGPSSYAALDAYVGDSVASARAYGGRQGGWVLADFHRAVMRPAIQALTSPHEHGGGTLVTGGGHRAEVSYLNYTTLTYTSEACLRVEPRPDTPAGMPRARVELMRHMCA